ncbi:hypothetical protein BGZ97_008902 [Linnemannia gamsii]|uniref:Uncharacterized protein n=1 Tax=Linnemannia gamsii TaxID=64522 RepID=A0A9P6R8Q9_9FUNG|nr:hypothetical protein BGZ97_008902 [Linnemannia gamsii]
MSLIIPLAQGAGRRSHKVLTASPVAAVVADHDCSQLISVFHRLNVLHNHYNTLQPRTLDNNIKNSNRRNYNAAITVITSHHRVLQASPRNYSTSSSGNPSDINSAFTNTNIPPSPSAFPNNLPRCSGITVKKKPCQRDGINAITELSTTAATATNKDSNNTSDAVVRYYCYQHDPRLVGRRQCIGYVASEQRQCRITCSESEIRTGGRPICNRHFQLGARLVIRRT